MRVLRSLLGVGLGFGFGLLAGQSHAASLPFTGALSVVIATLPPITVSGSGSATVLSGSHLTSVQLGGGTFAGTVSMPVTDPALYPINGVKAAFNNGPGSLGLGGKMAVKGSANVCLFGACTAAPPANIEVPFTLNGTRGVGLGPNPIKLIGGAVNVTVIGAPWTVGTATIAGSVSAMGFVHGPASAGASSAAASSGALRLVTPVVVYTSIGSAAIIPAFGILDLHFVPEPGTMLLVVSGLAGLALVGRRRMNR